MSDLYMRRNVLTSKDMMPPAFARALEGWDRATTCRNQEILQEELTSAGNSLADLLLRVLEDPQIANVLRQQTAGKS